MEKHYYPIRPGNKYKPPPFRTQQLHASLLVNKELHSNYLIEAEKAIVHVFNYDKKIMDKDATGTWDFARIFEGLVLR